MRLPHFSLPPPSSSLLSLLLSLYPSFIFANSIDCSHIREDGQSFDLHELGGPHSVVWTQNLPPSVRNTTFTIDICQPLKQQKDVNKADQCQTGSWEHSINEEDKVDEITRVIPIAGDFTVNDHRPMDATYTRLKTSASHADAEKEGIRIEMHGGLYPPSGKDKRKQEAIVEFLCDPDRTGLEERGMVRRKESDEDKDKEKEDDKKSLRFVSYGPQGDIDVLRLEWLTKHACEGQKDGGKEGKSGGHWGFFTWFIIIAFLGIAAYLIFGSWLNYNRYGARGWDLLPHGDTIRDIPYLLKDWIRRVINTVQGGGSRGGYSAV
ncbi:MAG: hypothetical protein M1836_001871 [Candelina mexicana]|nr:MAG: hypothetical protein M1836_001871 [Candelina mexicana]